MNDISEVYGLAADDASEHGRKRWRSQKCPFTGKRCIKKPKGVCSVEVNGEEFMVCPQRLRCNTTVLRDVCEDAFPGMQLIVKDRRKHISLPDSGIVVASEQVRLGHGVGHGIVDDVLACMRNGRTEVVSVESQTMDITGTYRGQLLAYRRRTRDGECIEVPCSRHGVNPANVRKRLEDQLNRKARFLEVLENCYRGMYFATLEPVWAHFEEALGKLEPVPAGFGGTQFVVLTYQLALAVGSGRKRGIVRCGAVRRFDLEEFSDRIKKGGVLPTREEVIEQIETATGRAIGNVATKRAARRAVSNYLGSEMADSLYKKPTRKRRTGRGGRVKATRAKRLKRRPGGVRKTKRPS